jgi:hypothetical protein
MAVGDGLSQEYSWFRERNWSELLVAVAQELAGQGVVVRPWRQCILVRR